MRHEDCGYRDQREADIARGCCPDCGDFKYGGRCHCTVPEVPEQPYDPSIDPSLTDPTIPF